MNASTPQRLFSPPSAKPKRQTQRNARQGLAGLVFSDVMAYWEEQGTGFLRRLAFHDPNAFASFVAKILPQRVEIETASPFDHVDEALLAISLRISKSIAFLPAEDRELLEMLLDKGEFLASQKNFQAEKSEEGVGGQSSQEFFGGEGTPLPQTGSSADRQIAAPALSGGAPMGFDSVAAQVEDDDAEAAAAAASRVGGDVLEGEFEEEP